MATSARIGILVAAIFLGIGAGDGPAFDVVSIKANTTGSPPVPAMRTLPGGHFVAANTTLKMLIEYAYHVLPNKDLVRGGPSWLDTARFDVDAKGAAAGVDDYRSALQALLQERFQLVIRRVTTDAPIYRLVVAKGGHKLRTAPARDCSAADAGCGIRGGAGRGIDGQGVSMLELADFLSFFSERAVRDTTALQGRFDIKTTGWAISRPRTAADALSTSAEQIDPNGISMFTVLDEQLGLKLEPATGPVESIIVQRAERPGGN